MRAYESGLSDGYRRLVDAVRPHKMALMQQLWHGGSATPGVHGTVPWAPSDIPNPMLGVVPQSMTKVMIDDVVGSFAAAARIVAESGLDGVEVHAAHGYLVQLFLSPATNRREDEYGGSFENRIRFLLETLAAVRVAAGPGLIVSVRLSPDGTSGVTAEDDRLVLETIENTGLIDFVNLSMGSYYDQPPMIAPMIEPSGYQLPTSARMAADTKLPRLVTGVFGRSKRPMTSSGRGRQRW
jgi:2,4-dienoyl-CoA reductase-like NADH-dependent reductase (Old Yellow Enzyme family)